MIQVGRWMELGSRVYGVGSTPLRIRRRPTGEGQPIWTGSFLRISWRLDCGFQTRYAFPNLFSIHFLFYNFYLISCIRMIEWLRSHFLDCGSHSLNDCTDYAVEETAMTFIIKRLLQSLPCIVEAEFHFSILVVSLCDYVVACSTILVAFLISKVTILVAYKWREQLNYSQTRLLSQCCIEFFAFVCESTRLISLSLTVIVILLIFQSD